MKFIAIISFTIILLSSCKVSNIVIPKSEAGNLPQKEGNHYVLGVRGECEMCQETIERVARYNVKGVSFAYWIQNDQKLLVDYDSTRTNIDSISIALAKSGYDTDRHIADTKAYNALPHCCRYR